jgi:hypothetical protein
MGARHGAKCVGGGPGSAQAQLSNPRANARVWRPAPPDARVRCRRAQRVSSAGDALSGAARARAPRGQVVAPPLGGGRAAKIDLRASFVRRVRASHGCTRTVRSQHAMGPTLLRGPERAGEAAHVCRVVQKHGRDDPRLARRPRRGQLACRHLPATSPHEPCQCGVDLRVTLARDQYAAWQ